MSLSLDERVSRYMAKVDPAVAGQRGHTTLLRASRLLVQDFGLSDDMAFQFLLEYNARCMPPWPQRELKRKLREARKRAPRKPIGHLRGDVSLDSNFQSQPVADPEPQPPPDLSRLRTGYPSELRRLSRAKGWSVESLADAQSDGILRFGPACGFACWVVTDASGISAEARRMDGLPFPAFEGGDERKAHTFKGSRKDWPVGLMPARWRRVSVITVNEGGPDLPTTFHFARLQNRTDILSVAMLGCNAGIHGFHPDAFELFRGRRVRIYPHTDALDRAEVWAKQLYDLGCKVDFFLFDGLFKEDGEPVNDLRDCLAIHPKLSDRLEELFP
jgi:hypothetical protein